MLYLPTWTYRVIYRIIQSQNTFSSRWFLYFEWEHRWYEIEATWLSFISQNTAMQTELQNHNNDIILKRVLYEVWRRENIHDIEQYKENITCEINRALHDYKYSEYKFPSTYWIKIFPNKTEKSLIYETLVYLYAIKLDLELLSSYALAEKAIKVTEELNRMRKDHINKYWTWIDKVKVNVIW